MKDLDLHVKILLDNLQIQNQIIKAQQLEDIKRKESELALFRETSTPIIERLKHLIGSIPIEEAQTPRPLEWFRSRLRGVEGKGAHAGQVGEALRKLNYQRKRCWSDEKNGFRSLWHPPKNNLHILKGAKNAKNLTS